MKNAESQNVNNWHEDECVDAGDTDNVTAWGATLVLMNALEKYASKKMNFSLSTMESLFPFVINEIFAKFYEFENCDSESLNEIIESMAEMGYLEKCEGSESYEYFLNSFSYKQADRILEFLPNKIKEKINNLIEWKFTVPRQEHAAARFESMVGEGY